jgi:hypothetical protein
MALASYRTQLGAGTPEERTPARLLQDARKRVGDGGERQVKDESGAGELATIPRRDPAHGAQEKTGSLRSGWTPFDGPRLLDSRSLSDRSSL